MDKTKLIITYFRLNEKERADLFIAKNSQQFLKNGSFAVGSSHLVVLEENGTVSAYGDNGYGQCDTANWNNIKKVVAGDFHTAALSNNGKVVAVGDNTYGQCNVLDWNNIVELFANRNLTIGIDSKGKIWATSKRYSTETISLSENELDEIEITNINEFKESPDERYKYVSNDNGIRIYKFIGKEKNVVIPEGIDGMPVQTICANAFANNRNLQWIKLPGSLREINANAFKGCSNLEYVLMQHGVERIGHHAFADCNLKVVSLPESVVSIGGYAFANCRDLKEVLVPDGIQTINTTAFSGCNHIENVDITSKAQKKIWNYRQIFNLKN